MTSQALSYILNHCIFILLIISTISCSDDLDFMFRYGVEEGKPSACRINYQIGDIQPQSRADMPEGMDSEIKSMWIGFFKADASGNINLEKYKFYGSREDMEDLPSGYVDITNITSGNYYIMAVGNPEENYGICPMLNITEATLLSNILYEVKTLDQYKNIAVVRRTDFSILVPANPLPMQGFFVPISGNSTISLDSPNCTLKSNEVANFASSTIAINPSNEEASEYTLPGCLHFHRLFSHIKFNITDGTTEIKDENGNNVKYIESLSVTRAKVFNIPASSWLYERADNANIDEAGKKTERVNSGDIIQYPNSSVIENYQEATTTFLTSDFTEKDGTYSFDWWQMENRRMSNNCADFKSREYEYKSNKLNTAVYKALNPQYETTNLVSDDNSATFVEIKVRMKVNKNPSAYGVEDENWPTQVAGTEVEATYTIHLGGMDNNPKDFMCRRNHKYIYNIKIVDVNKIVVEAHEEDHEEDPHQEGIVTFITGNYYELDAHYGVFNIELSDLDRSDLIWMIRAYDDNDSYKDITNGAYIDGIPNLYDYTNSKVEGKYWNWIEFRPTTSIDEIAEYQPYDPHKQGEGPHTFTLKEIRDIANWPGITPNSTSETATRSRSDETGSSTEGGEGKPQYSNTPKYYTVFVNEYVYRKNGGITDSSDTEDWENFVNLPDRQLWLRVKVWRSSDNESAVMNAKYALRQKSIQTFFKDGDKVFGAEHGNETFFESLYNGDDSLFQWGGSSGETCWEMNASVLKKGEEYLYWSDILESNSLETTVTSDTRSQKQADQYVRKLNLKGSLTMHRACLNRNRDLNGNHKIDEEEIRWILPNENMYTQMAFGAENLSSRLFDFNKPFDATKKRNYHYGMIEGNMFWAEEGYSTGAFTTTGDNRPTQVRCIRLLGSDYDNNPKSNVPPVYESVNIDETNTPHFIIFNFPEHLYREKVDAPLPPHMLGSDYNRPYKKIQYYNNNWGYTDTIKHSVHVSIDGLQSYQVNDIQESMNIRWEALGYGDGEWKSLDYASRWYWALFAFNPCDIHNVNGEKGWRIPNQTELAAISLLGRCPSGSWFSPSCTFNPVYTYQNDSKYDKYYRAPLAIYGRNKRSSLSASEVSGSYFICVRDVE